MAVELQQNASGILGEIFFIEALFPAYEKKVSLDPFMAYKSKEYLNTMYLHEAMNQLDSTTFQKDMQK